MNTRLFSNNAAGRINADTSEIKAFLKIDLEDSAIGHLIGIFRKSVKI